GAVGGNVYKHLLMFNYRGDPNGRHNLPGKPMLDFVSSTLFVLGLAYSLYRWREPCYFLLVIWFGVMLCGGVFSLPFEAPQSLRAIGTLPVAYVLTCVPLALMERESRRALGHLGERAFIMALLPFLAFVGWDNYNVYFNMQARDFAVWNSFSTRETIIAREANRLGHGYDIYLAPTLTNHLTTRFLAPDFKEHLVLEPTTALPLRRSGRQGVALFVDPDSAGTRALIESYYPHAAIKEFRSPYDGPATLYVYLLTPDDVERVQGLPARYYRGEGADIAPLYRQGEVLDFNWRDETPLPLPFHAEWMGTLLAPAYGQYSLSFEAPGQVELWLDGVSLLTGSGKVTRAVTLAKGLHALRIRCTVAEPGPLRLRWQPPEADDLTVIPREALYRPPVTANGLLGSYYRNDEWAEPPAFVRIDPRVDFYFHLIPLSRPYTVEWQGQIDIPATGTYRLGTEVLDACWLYIDGELLLENLQPNHYQEATIDLTAGRHDIRLRFLDRTDHSHVYLYWTPPDGVKEIVPHERLFPPERGAWTEAEGR
ncbi:MAG: PA14 domain-containing protein, partial [Anaerolineae bacterium]